MNVQQIFTIAEAIPLASTLKEGTIANARRATGTA